MAARRTAVLALIFAGAPAAAAAMTLASADLRDGGPMPQAQLYSRCGGQNVSPDLVWAGAPPGTKSFALTMIDLSVRPNDFSHWIIVDVPPGVMRIARGAGTLPPPARGVTSNMRADRYAGPCPPPRTGVHRYQVTVWALPSAEIEVQPDGPATTLGASLARASIGHASITVTAGR